MLNLLLSDFSIRSFTRIGQLFSAEIGSMLINLRFILFLLNAASLLEHL